MKSIIFPIFGLLIASCAVFADTQPSLQLYTETFPPYNFAEDGQIKGINADIVAAACKAAKINCEITLLPWQRAMSLTLSTPNSGIFSTSKTPERLNKFHWLGPIVSSNACLYKLKTRSDVVVENTSSLLNYKMGIPRNDVYESVLKNLGLEEGKQYITYSNKHDDSKMFKEGKLDLLIGSSVTLKSQLSLVGLSSDDVEPVLLLNDDSLQGNYLALNLDVNPSIVKQLEQTLEEMKAFGAFDPIIAKYSKPLSEAKRNELTHLPICLDGVTDY